MARYSIPKKPKPVTEERRGGFMQTLLSLMQQSPQQAAQGMVNPLGGLGAVVGGGALGQVRNLERLYRALQSMGVPVQRAPFTGMHPDRYFLDFLAKGISENRPLLGSVSAVTKDPRKLFLSMQDPSFAHAMTAEQSPLNILRILRSLFGSGY